MEDLMTEEREVFGYTIVGSWSINSLSIVVSAKYVNN
jgi:hypothetical protein